MKFLHIGDLHLGRSIGDFDLVEDQRYILDQILDIAKSHAVDAILVAGDVYDKSVPSEAAVRLFDYFIRRMAEEGVKAFIISGNHDSDERMNFGSSLFRANGIYIAAKYEGDLMHLKAEKDGKVLKVICQEKEETYEAEKVTGIVATSVMEESGDAQKKEKSEDIFKDEVNIYLMPFIKASQVRHFFPDEKIENYEDAVRVVLKNAGVDPNARNVLVAHQFVVGSTEVRADVESASPETIGEERNADMGENHKKERNSDTEQTEEKAGNAARGKNITDPTLGGSEGIATQNVGLVEKIGADCLDAFDYVALGHIHSAQAVGREEVRYSGSPLKYSLSEANHVKSVPIVTLGKKGEVQVELVPLHPMRDLRHIRGRMEQLLAKENITAPEDFIYVTLTDENVVDEAMGIFQQYYPNTIRIEYDNSHTKEIQEFEGADVTTDVSFDELIAGFYRQMYGCDISAEERKLMRAVAREAGIEIGEDEIAAENEEKEVSDENRGIEILEENCKNQNLIGYGADGIPTEEEKAEVLIEKEDSEVQSENKKDGEAVKNGKKNVRKAGDAD